MNESMRDVERRAEAAGSELLRVARGRRRPVFDPDRPVELAATVPETGSSSRNRWLAVAAVMALVAGSAAVLWQLRSDDSETIAAGPATEVPAYVLDPVPEGFEAVAMEAPGGNDPFGRGEAAPLHLYGPGSERAKVAVTIDPNGFDPERRVDETGDGESAPEVFDLDGRRAYRGDPEFVGLQVSDIVVEVGDTAVVVFGSADTDVIDAIARSTTVSDAEPVVDTAGLPEGWMKTGVTALDAVYGGFVEPDSAKLLWYGQSYEQMEAGSEPGPTMVQVVSGRTSAEEPLDMGGVVPAFDTARSDVDVDGHPAVVRRPATDENFGMPTINWEPEDGVTVILGVYGYDVDDAEVIALAESVRPATEEEWQQLLSVSEEMQGETAVEESGSEIEPPTPSTVEPGDVVEGDAADPGASDSSDTEGPSGMIGSGTRPGLHWEASVRDRILEIEMLGLEPGVEARIDGADIDEPLPIAVTEAGDLRVIGGYVGAGRQVAVVLDGADPVSEWGMEQRDGSRFWFVDASGAETVGVTLLGADGRELAGREMGWAEAAPTD